MIDIHTHILFGVDDGAKNYSETRRLLQEAVNQGIDRIVLTPHYRKDKFEASNDTVREHYEEVVHLAKEIDDDLIIMLGREIYCNPTIMEDFSPEWTFGNTNVVLLEFRQDSNFMEIDNYARKFLSKQYRVILAHIERYPKLTIDEIIQLREMGCVIQVNAAHVGKIGFFDPLKDRKRCVTELLDLGIVDIVASDVHNQTSRKNYMQQAFDYVLKKYGITTAQRLFVRNARRILDWY